MKELISIYNAAATVATNIEKQALTFDLKDVLMIGAACITAGGVWMLVKIMKESLTEMKLSHMAIAEMVNEQKTEIALHGQALESHSIRIEHLEAK